MARPERRPAAGERWTGWSRVADEGAGCSDGGAGQSQSIQELQIEISLQLIFYL